MSIEFQCGCGKKFRTASENAGKAMKCSHCGKKLTVPAPESGEDEEIYEAELAEDQDDRAGIAKRGVPLVIKAPVMALNLGAVEELFRYAEAIGADCRVDHKSVHAKDGGLVPLRVRATEEELVPYYRGPYTSCAIPEEYLENPNSEGPMCAAANRFCTITASGDVMACNILPGSGGNVREQSFREIWERSEWLQRIRSIRRRDVRVCSGCDKIAYCERCHAQALVEDGDLYGPSSWSCEHAAVVERIAEERRRERAADARG